MPILRRPSQSNIAADGVGFPEAPSTPEESGAFAVPRRSTVKISAVSTPRDTPLSSIPPPNELRSLVVPPPAPPPSSPTANRPSVKRDTVKMAPVRPTEETPASGRMLDTVDFADGGRIALELSTLPAGRAHAQGRPPTPLSMPKTSVTPITPLGSSDVLRRDRFDPRRPGIFAFAGFGLPPESLVGAPSYAIRVYLRKSILRDGLAVARRQRSADVDLYEAALRMADREWYLKGVGAIGVAAVVAVMLLVLAVELLA